MSASRTTKHEPRYTALLAAAQFVAIERESAIAQAHHHLVQMLGHLRAAHHYVSTHGIDLALPSQTDLAELSRSARG